MPLKAPQPPHTNTKVFLSMPPPPPLMVVKAKPTTDRVRSEEKVSSEKESLEKVLLEKDMSEKEKEFLPLTSPSKAESNTFPSKRNTLNTNKLRRSTKCPLNTKKSNTKKSSEAKEFPMREPSLTTTLLRLRSSTSEEKSRKQSWLRSPLKEPTKEFNTSPSRPKLFTIPKERTTFLSPPKPEPSTSASLKKDGKKSKANTEAPARSEEKEKSEEKNTLNPFLEVTPPPQPTFNLQDQELELPKELLTLTQDQPAILLTPLLAMLLPQPLTRLDTLLEAAA